MKLYMISEDGRSDTEIRTRIAQTKQTFTKLKTILTNKRLLFKTRDRVLECYVYSILTYGCEVWTITRTIEKRIDATVMWFVSRMLKIPWVAKRTNKRVLEEINRGLRLKIKIRSQQTKFFGYVMRRKELENFLALCY